MKQSNRLTARTIASLTSPGYHADGGGLYLQVTKAGSKSWIFRFSHVGRAREMGLGSASVVTLQQARIQALDCRKQLHLHIDPIQARRAKATADRLVAAATMTFKECADTYITDQRLSWRNAKHADQWTATLTTYAYPVIGDLPVQTIDTSLVMRVLEPIWWTKSETASRLRGRIEKVLDWAAVREFRAGDNPARWKGHIEQLLPARASVQKVVHHAALPYAEMADFMKVLRQHTSVAARGLEFQILTATRTSEVLGATWLELDDDKKLWTIPAERMKASREHRVPLSAGAMSIIAERRAQSQSEFVFPGMRPKRSLSNMAFLQLLKRLGRSDITSHGFRSSFRDWAADQTDYPREVAEMALAHAIGDKVEAAYRRGDLMEKRKALMDDWFAFSFGGQTRPGG